MKNAKLNFGKSTLFAILMMIVCLVGCAPEQDHQSSSPNMVTFSPKPSSGIETDLKLATLHCPTPVCPENVGLLFVEMGQTYTSAGKGQCTGFLVAENIVATNSHCIPPAAKQNKDACSSSLAIRFPSRDNKQSIFPCLRVLNFSEVHINRPDFAFFEIALSGRAPVKIAQSGIEDRSKLRVVKVTPLDSVYFDKRGGTIESSQCTAALSTLLNMESVSPWSETAVAVGCSAIEGNSGSPVYNDRDEVVGILQSHMLEQWNVILKASFAKYMKDIPTVIAPHFIFTNLSCVPDPITNRSADECQRAKVLTFADCLQTENPQNEAAAQAAAKNWNESLPPIFIYRKVTSEKDATVRAVPACVVPRKFLGMQYDSFVEKRGIYGFRSDVVELSYPFILKIGAKMKVDRQYRMLSEFDFFEEFRTSYEFKLKKESTVWSGHYFIPQTIRGIEFSRIRLPLVIAECTDEQVREGSTQSVWTTSGEEITEAEFKRRRASSPKPVHFCRH